MKTFIAALFILFSTLSYSGQNGAKSNIQNNTQSSTQSDTQSNTQENALVVIKTSMGDITVELFSEKSPKTVENFINYIKIDGYKDSMFHRVIKGFMVQGGGHNLQGRRLKTYVPVKNESFNGLSNSRGTISMARTNSPDSATRQFFINHKDNLSLDEKMGKAGYTVFGKVTTGMSVVDKIAEAKTDRRDKPLETVKIISISLIE